MIELTKFNDVKILLNSDLIETVEETPDTVITLINGKKILVKESSEQICKSIVEFKKNINACTYMESYKK